MLITVHGGTHSWVLRDPEALPGIVNELLKGPLGRAYRDAVDAAGLDGDRATIAELEEAFYEPDALVLELTPPLEFVRSKARHREPQFEWTIADHRVRHTVEESAS